MQLNLPFNVYGRVDIEYILADELRMSQMPDKKLRSVVVHFHNDSREYRIYHVRGNTGSRINIVMDKGHGIKLCRGLVVDA